MNEYEIIEDFVNVLKRRCGFYYKAGCARDNLCDMAGYCHKGFNKLSKNELKNYTKSI